MSVLKTSLPPDKPQHCPYAGLQDDSDTVYGYSSPWNHCHNVKPVAVPSLDHQRQFCLTDRYTLCPIVHSEEKKSIPKNLRMEGKRSGAGALLRSVVITVFLAVGIVIALFFFGKIPLLNELNYSFPVLSDNLMSIEETATHEIVPARSPEPMAPEKNPTETPTMFIEEAPLATPIILNVCAYALEYPFGTEPQFLMHRVGYGESLTMLANDYGTSEAAISAINAFLPSPLWAELVIVIPVNISDVSGIPTLKPTFVEEKNLSMEELAEKLSVSVNDLVGINQIGEACQNFSGWLLVPADKIAP